MSRLKKNKFRETIFFKDGTSSVSSPTAPSEAKNISLVTDRIEWEICTKENKLFTITLDTQANEIMIVQFTNLL
jgi:hypothetical protein